MNPAQNLQSFPSTYPALSRTLCERPVFSYCECSSSRECCYDCCGVDSETKICFKSFPFVIVLTHTAECCRAAKSAFKEVCTPLMISSSRVNDQLPSMQLTFRCFFLLWFTYKKSIVLKVGVLHYGRLTFYGSCICGFGRSPLWSWRKVRHPRGSSGLLSHDSASFPHISNSSGSFCMPAVKVRGKKWRRRKGIQSPAVWVNSLSAKPVLAPGIYSEKNRKCPTLYLRHIHTGLRYNYLQHLPKCNVYINVCITFKHEKSFRLTAGQLSRSCSKWLPVVLSRPQQLSWLSRSYLVLFSNIPQAEVRRVSWKKIQQIEGVSNSKRTEKKTLMIKMKPLYISPAARGSLPGRSMKLQTGKGRRWTEWPCTERKESRAKKQTCKPPLSR